MPHQPSRLAFGFAVPMRDATRSGVVAGLAGHTGAFGHVRMNFDSCCAFEFWQPEYLALI
jgi:hypothetical protein